jgi:SNF2 family DNA or RNA helicase
LDEGARLGTAFGRFKSRFFFPTDYHGYKWEPRPGAERAVHELIAPISVRLDRNDYLDLPPVTFNPVWVTLPPEVMAVYREFERRMFLELDATSEVEAVNAAVLTMKCAQIANGAVYTTPDPAHPEDRHASVLHDAKLEALAEIVDGTGSPVMVAYQFAHDLARLKEWRDAPHLGGGQTQTTDAIVTAWNRGDLPLLYVHPQSASHGLNMQRGPGHTLVFFSQTWSAEQRAQLIARLDRSGQASPVVVHDILARDTVDEVIAAAVERKLNGQAALLNALNDYRLAQEMLE